MTLTLNANQRRVLGVLIEKSYTTPDQYPLTVNAILAGCNQKSNRNPVMELGERDVMNVLQELMFRKFVQLSATPRGARSNRYEHDITAQHPWSPKEQAVLTELMLRGPQTVGELRTRSDRMASMPDLQTVQNILDAMVANDPPEIVNIGRAPGQSAIRYRHNFYAEDEQPESAAASSSATAMPTPTPAPTPDLVARLDDLEARIVELEARMQALSG